MGFIAQQGLSGSSDPVVVPAGHVYVVKQLTFYSNPFVQTVRGFFHDLDSGAALFACAAPVTATEGAQPGWFGFYGALVFTEGRSFGWSVTAGIGDAADVYAGGYDLIA